MRLAGWGVLIFAVWGCGGGGDAVPLSEFPSRLAQTQCARIFRCCSVAQAQKIYGTIVTSEATCVQSLSRLKDALITGISDAEKAGHIRYNGATAGTCFEKLTAAACTTASNDMSVVPECDAYLEPLVASGGMCDGDSECKTGFCDRPIAANTPGICHEIPTKGMPCTSRCAPGSTCNLKQVCADPAADGAFCITDDDCVSGNCDSPTITSGTCKPAVATCGPSP